MTGFVPRLTKVGIVLGIIIVLLGISDIATTMAILAKGGTELNPLVVWMMSVWGSFWPIPKLCLHFIGGLTVAFFFERRDIKVLTILLTILYVFIIISNTLTLVFI